VFYAENELEFTMNSLDGYEVVRYLKHINLQLSEVSVDTKCFFTYDGSSGWPNLKRWFQSIWRSDEAGCPVRSSPEAKAAPKGDPLHVAFKLFAVAKRLKKSGLDWTAAEGIIRSVGGVVQASAHMNKRLFEQDS